jgi:hypothetical protein|nr:MAG TPA: hypothetical protein [Caudoviricetes sp.]
MEENIERYTNYKMNKNDDRILELKEKIEKKKLELSGKNTRFVPITNCILLLGGTYNLNTFDEISLKIMLVRLHSYKMVSDDLGISDLELSGYSIDDWISDIKNKMEVLNVKNEIANLKRMEAKLDKLLSEDKKTELELDDIASLLG